MKKILLVLGVLLVLSNVWGKKRLEQEIESGVWRVQYLHDGTYHLDEAYRKATCNLVRLAKKQGYGYFAIEDPWIGEEEWPPPRGSTRYVLYRLEAVVRFSNEPVAGGLPRVEDLKNSFMCGKWTVAYMKNSEAMEPVRAAWGTPRKVRTFRDFQLSSGTGNQQVSLEFSRPPEEVVVSLGCRLRRGTLSWEVYGPSGNIVWQGSSEERKLQQTKRFPGAAGEWGCRLSLVAGEGACRVLIGDDRD